MSPGQVFLMELRVSLDIIVLLKLHIRLSPGTSSTGSPQVHVLGEFHRTSATFYSRAAIFDDKNTDYLIHKLVNDLRFLLPLTTLHEFLAFFSIRWTATTVMNCHHTILISFWEADYIPMG